VEKSGRARQATDDNIISCRKGVGMSGISGNNMDILYIIEYNPHPSYSFKGPKIRCGLDLQS
jgi:hypothetical protein